jgi:hypothetical protein
VSEQATANPPAAPPPNFENFLSDQIGASLKENPKLVALNKDLPPEERAAQQSQQSQQPQPQDRSGPEPTPEQIQEGSKNLLPDFSKLAFGTPSEKATLEEQRDHTPAAHGTPVKPPEEFPEKLASGTPQAQDAWARMRTSNQALFKQNAELVAKLKEHEERLKEFDGKTPMASDEYEKLTSERETLSKELRLVKLEATPEYQKAVQRPMGVVEDEIKRLGTKYSVNQHQIRSALTEPDRDKQADLLSKVTDTFNDRDKLTLFKLADDAKEISRRRNILQNDVKQALDYIEAKRAAEAEKSKAEQKTEWEGSKKKAWKAIGDTLYLARPLEGNDAWNKGLEDTKKLVDGTDLHALPAVDQAKVLVQAALLPRAVMAIHQLWNMYQEANSALKRYQGVTPGAGGGSSSGGEAFGGSSNGHGSLPSGSEESGMSFIDAIEARISGTKR